VADLFVEEELYRREIVALTPTRIVRRKNVETGLEIVAALKKMGKSVRWIITGAPDPYNEDAVQYFEELVSLRRRLRLTNDVIFLCERWKQWVSNDDLRGLYGVSNMLLFPSEREGFGIPVLEAAITGLLVVVSDIPALRELAGDEQRLLLVDGQDAEPFARVGAGHITFHIETTDEPEALVDELHKLGCTAGITLNPETPVEAIETVAPMCEMVLVMTVHPGFGGQAFMPEAAKKIKRIRQLVGPGIRIEVDGGIDPQTAPTVVSYGADTLVAGNAIFAEPDRVAAISAIREACG
jgi:ribulose-phosphate 3-epimerase